MGNPEQSDLIEYLADEAGQAVARSLTVPGRARAAVACVQIEHTAILSRSEQATTCVQFKHKERTCRIEGGKVDAEPNATAAPMSPRRLLVCLAALGWPERELARRTGRLQTTVRRWTGERSSVPDDVAAWVKMLAAFHRAHPAPRAGQGLPAD